jgi:hypothetical protein
MSLICNEQAKRSATHLNGIAIALAGGGWYCDVGELSSPSFALERAPRCRDQRALYLSVGKPTLDRAEGLDLVEGVMNALELFALLIGSLLMFGAGLVVYFFAMRQAKEDRPPAE